MEKPVNFSGGTVFFSVLLLAWFVFAILLCLQGFGLDTDAWLMAQTAGRLRAGEGYDPARSFGNPAWEFLITILQPDYEFRFSNGLNLLFGLLFLWRLRLLLPGIPLRQYQLSCAAFCLLPVFTEAATSSMELMPAWYLFLECLLAIQQKRPALLLLMSSLLSFTRPEFSLYLLAAAHYSGRKNFLLMLPGLAASMVWIFWALGKNPPPFQELNELPRFYAGRIWFLIRQAGFLLPVYLFLLVRSFRQQNPLLKWPGRISLSIFLLVPFEWAYAFPALLSGMLATGDQLDLKKTIILAGMSISSTFVSPLSGLPALYLKRKKMLEQFSVIEAFKPSQNTLLLDGATFLPTRYHLWERSHQNRLFHKKNSQFWVAERLRQSEIDSFKNKGFRIGRFNQKEDQPWLEYLP